MMPMLPPGNEDGGATPRSSSASSSNERVAAMVHAMDGGGAVRARVVLHRPTQAWVSVPRIHKKHAPCWLWCPAATAYMLHASVHVMHTAYWTAHAHS
jgi:hypothetical protein